MHRVIRGTMALVVSLMLLAPLSAAAQDATPATACAPMDRAAAETLLTAYFTTFDAVDLEGMAALVSDDLEFDSALYGILRGPEGIKTFLAEAAAAQPGGVHVIEQIVTDGASAYVLWSDSYDLEQVVDGTPIPGTKREFTAIQYFRFACGKITYSDTYLDQKASSGKTDDSPETHFTGEAPAACAANDPDAMAAAITDMWAGYNAGDAEAYLAAIADDAVRHPSAGPVMIGKAAMMEQAAATFAAMGGGKVEFRDLLVDGEYAAIRWTENANPTGTVFGAEADGDPISYKGMSLYRFQCGQIVEMWSEANIFGARKQIEGGS